MPAVPWWTSKYNRIGLRTIWGLKSIEKLGDTEAGQATESSQREVHLQGAMGQIFVFLLPMLACWSYILTSNMMASGAGGFERQLGEVHGALVNTITALIETRSLLFGLFCLARKYTVIICTQEAWDIRSTGILGFSVFRAMGNKLLFNAVHGNLL